MSFQIQGISNTVAEVESATRAIRVVNRPDDYGALGIYSIAENSGVMAAGMASSAPICAFRNSTANAYLVRQIRLSVAASTTAFAAGVASFNLYHARSYTVNATGGTAATVTGNNQKRRTSMATTGVADIRVTTTTALTSGTWVLDAQPTGSIIAPVTATAGLSIIQPTYLFDPRISEYPLVCDQNEGFVIQGTVPATGIWSFSVGIDWLELASY